MKGVWFYITSAHPHYVGFALQLGMYIVFNALICGLEQHYM